MTGGGPRPALISFDCYGTLIDWHGGLVGALETIGVPASDRDRLAEWYVGEEAAVEAGEYLSYREVTARALERTLRRAGLPLSAGRRSVIADALPAWRPFPEAPAALRDLHRVCPLAVLSNIDDDLLDASIRALGTSFAWRVTAQAVRSYKPAPAHFRRILEITGRAPGEILHVAASVVHDLEPTRALGIPHLWIRRRGEAAPAWLAADRVLPDLAAVPVWLSRQAPGPLTSGGR